MAPAQFFAALRNSSQWITFSDTNSRARDSECYFGDFDDEGDEPDSSSLNFDEELDHQTLPNFSCTDFDSVSIKPDNFNYCLIEVDNEDLSSGVPVLTEDSVAHTDRSTVSEEFAVTAVTGSGNRLNGVLLSRTTNIRLPNATRFIHARLVQFENSRRVGDTGSFVWNAETSAIYMAAFDADGRIGITIPIADVLKDVIAQSKALEPL